MTEASKQDKDDPSVNVIHHRKTRFVEQYVFATLTAATVRRLVALDCEGKKSAIGGETASDPDPRPIANRTTIHRIWPDFEIRSQACKSFITVKADAAHRSFCAHGKGITWGVVDSGIDADHSHFLKHKNIDPASRFHADFSSEEAPGSPLEDGFGHGTHVAGIIAGEMDTSLPRNSEHRRASLKSRDSDGKVGAQELILEAIAGMAPQTTLVSLKVLNRVGSGNVSNVIAAIQHVQQINGYGREIKIHGLNFSLGYDFDARWFACGHSPLCVEINRLVKSGVVVVAAAGNTGYGTHRTEAGERSFGMDLTINDPGNAELAITVGSTHREEPFRYGVSYFSSKGPTGDGRRKPDLLAPGERIVSCAAKESKSWEKAALPGNKAFGYLENSGTSMASPHVSGVIAAFLSIRREFIGEPERVKRIFMDSATCLGRDRKFQGAGLVDLMRAIQSV